MMNTGVEGILIQMRLWTSLSDVDKKAGKTNCSIRTFLTIISTEDSVVRWGFVAIASFLSNSMTGGQGSSCQIGTQTMHAWVAASVSTGFFH